jgi:uncharacterized membrane protein
MITRKGLKIGVILLLSIGALLVFGLMFIYMLSVFLLALFKIMFMLVALLCIVAVAGVLGAFLLSRKLPSVLSNNLKNSSINNEIEDIKEKYKNGDISDGDFEAKLDEAMSREKNFKYNKK